MTLTSRNAFSAVDSALIALTRASPTSGDTAYIAAFFADAPDWFSFESKIRHNDVAPLVYLNLERLGMLGRLPEWLLLRLRDRREKIVAANRARLLMAADFLARAKSVGVRVIVLKGVLFAETLYRDAGYKKMNDMDILVRFEDIEATKRIYSEMGLLPLVLLEGGAEDPDPRKTHHLPTFVSRDMKFVIGTHWALTSPKSGFHIDHETLWQRAHAVSIGGVDAWALSSEDALHHLCVHFHYYKTGLKELGDFAALLNGCNDFDWKLFDGLVRSSETQTPVFRALKLVETVYESGVPKSLLAACRAAAEPFTVQDTEVLVARRNLLLMSRSTWSSEIEKAYMAFSFESRFKGKLRWFLIFWHRILRPPLSVLYRTNAVLPGEKPLGMLFYANLVRTAREIGRGYGLAAFGLIMAVSTFELISCLLHSVTGTEDDRMAALCKTFGVNDAGILQLMDAME
ncbi:MAG: nucleotidyltransferase family protein [Candidatus Riflebacteria bacterium]|nr:nucleotidyltransferase family protein [Candidatus Riflebacteria bacterium]